MMRVACVVAFVMLLTVNGIHANVDDNEVDIPEYYMYNGIKLYRNELSCTMTGGVCVHKTDCAELTYTSNLCPNNAHLGVECCYEMVVKPATCDQYMGECMSRCHKTLMRPATNCDQGQVCCVLV